MIVDGLLYFGTPECQFAQTPFAVLQGAAKNTPYKNLIIFRII